MLRKYYNLKAIMIGDDGVGKKTVQNSISDKRKNIMYLNISK
jgi:hypothetical protein